MELIASILVVIIMYKVDSLIQNWRVDNYPISKVDSSKMAKDAGKSRKKIEYNMINGKYDKD